MQKILSAGEMREIDRLTTEKYGISSLILMENAAHGAARAILDKFGGSVVDKSVLVLCGKGNNGGDGAALARILWTLGADVEVVLLGKIEDAKGDALVNFEILRKISEQEGFELAQADLSFETVETLDEWLDYDSLNFHTDDPDILIDALFGTGLTEPLKDLYEQAAAFMSALNCDTDGENAFVVSLDVPSGICADDSGLNCICPCAHLTVAFTAPKTANVLPPACNYNGELQIVNIGSPCELINNSPSQLFLTEEKDARDWLAKTKYTSGSYKNKRGHALVIAGSREYTGAAVLAGNAAMISGVGLTTLATSESAQNAVAAKISEEIITRGLPETKGGSIASKGYETIEKMLEKIDAVGIGCGLSAAEKSTKDFVRQVIEKRRTPIVVDADALNALAPFDLQGSPDAPLILTPHEGEFLRLLGTKNKKILKNRVKAVRDFAVKHQVILVLKGERVLIGAPDGRVVVNPNGNSGLGKAGNGDTLTGIITGFAAQAAQLKIDIYETVVAAVYLASLAGDIAAKKIGKRSMLASDVRESLGEAMESIID